MIKYLRYFVLLLVLGMLISCNDTKKQPPNVILIMTDDQGYGDFGLHGCDSCYTPNLDQFAKDGIQFDRFYVSPVCAPTRASLLTGRYHLKTGTTWVTHRKEVMNSDETTIAEVFKTAGYKTGIFGKWHNGEQYPHHPNGQGFDEFLGFAAGHWNNYFDTHLEYNGQKIETEGYITDVLTDKAMEFIQKNKEKPFFCYIPYNAPHSPFQVPDQYFDKYKKMSLTDKNASIYGMNENIDDNFGRIMRMLKEEQLDENTIVVFLTDNGPNGNRFNGNMKGRKAKVDEGGVRVPLFIQWKNHLPKGKVIKELAAHIDLMPTLMELCDIQNNNHKPFDGQSLVALLQNEASDWEERNIYSIQNDGTWNDFPASVRNNRYRLVKDHSQNILLYDMITDPSQTTDIAEKEPQTTQQLQSDLENWFKEVTKNGIEPPLVEIGHNESKRVILPAPEAFLDGNVKFEGGMGWANDWIKNWQNIDDRASWKLKAVKAGNYKVSIQYTSNQNGMVTHVAIGNQKLTNPDIKLHNPVFLPSPDRVTRGEVYEKEWETMPIGTVNVKEGEHEITISFDKIEEQTELHIKALIIESE